MSPDSGRLRQYGFLLSIFAFISLCILCRGIYGAVGVHRIKSLISAYSGYKSGAGSQSQDHSPTIDRETFISIASSTPLQPFTPSAIRAKCASRPWPSDLLFQCQGIHGGIGNVRQETLACMRWAMEHGSALVIPGIHRRKSTNASDDIRNEYETETMPFDYLFDREELVSRLKEACPQMRVYERLEDVPFSEGAVGVSAQYVRTPGLRNASWISENRQPVGNITVIDFPGTLLEYKPCEDGAEFADAFGKLLSFRKDVHRLAATILYELSTRFNLSLDPAVPIPQNAFLGIHLRTAKDAQDQGWLPYATQSSLYARLARTRPHPAIYVASGNVSSIALLSAQLAPAVVVTKHSLLTGDDRAALDGLTWDQQGLVDYLVLEKASVFLGMCASSFTWGVVKGRRAGRGGGTCEEGVVVRREVRGLEGGDEEGGVEEGGREQGEGEVETETEDPRAWEDNCLDLNYKDELSIVIGGSCVPDFRHYLWP